VASPNIHLRIRAFRKLKGYTQNDLAELMGVSVGVLGQIERGSRKPDGHILRRISEVLGIDLEELNPSLRERNETYVENR
jgi:transcriptional regulator with XRE-family HTH domain